MPDTAEQVALEAYAECVQKLSDCPSISSGEVYGIEAAVQALREKGMLVEWRMDIENAPKGKTLTAYRPDAGCFPAMFGSMEYFHLSEREIEQVPEDDFFADSWWSFDHDGAHRLEGDELPTHFALITPPEEIEKPDNCRSCGANGYGYDETCGECGAL